MQGETQAPGAIGGDQQRTVAPLEAIHLLLPLGRGQSTREQASLVELLRQVLGGRHEGREHHHRFPLAQQQAHQPLGCREFVVGADLAQGRQNSQHLRLTTHLPQGRPAAVIVDLDLKAVLEAIPLGLGELHRHQAPLLGR